MAEPERCLESQTLFEGKLLKVRADRVALPGGRESVREVVAHPGAVAMVPITDDGQVVLIEQWRYAAGGPLLEIPAGTLEPNEEPAACAARELAEEIGCRAGHLEPLGAFFVAPGYSSERIHLFLATHLRPAEGDPEEDENIEQILKPLDEAVAMVRDGQIEDAKTIIGLLLAAERSRG
ncbi:MAG: NUDIX hydrolase [Armatimonadetes bacterium]|nr:NUDIX hydrolase [Armatimonadota bacterium]